MAHLGRGEYALLLHLADNGRQAVVVEGNKAKLADGAAFRNAVVEILVGAGLVSRIQSNGIVELELSTAGRADLDLALAQKWVVDHSGLHEESASYRFEVSDPVTGRRFIVAVAQGAGADLANRLAYSVIATPSVRASCRKLATIGPEAGFTVQMADGHAGAGEISVWRKL